MHLVGTHLIDSLCCRGMESYIAAVLVSLSSMIPFEIPFVHVLTKVDCIVAQDLLFDMDVYESAQDLSAFLARYLRNNKKTKILGKRNFFLKSTADFLDSVGLVEFCFLDIQDKVSVGKLVSIIDVIGEYCTCENMIKTSCDT